MTPEELGAEVSLLTHKGKGWPGKEMPEEPCPECGTVDWHDHEECLGNQLDRALKERDDSNRALEMERAAHRVTADRLKAAVQLVQAVAVLTDVVQMQCIARDALVLLGETDDRA